MNGVENTDNTDRVAYSEITDQVQVLWFEKANGSTFGIILKKIIYTT